MMPYRGDDAILVDTSVLHELAEQKSKGLLADALLWDMTPLTCMLTVGEAIVCIHRNRPRDKQFPKRLMGYVRRWQWLEYPRESPQLYATIVASYNEAGGKKAKYHAADFWILTCAIANQIPLMTADGELAKLSTRLRHPTMHIHDGPGGDDDPRVHISGDLPR